MNGTDELLPWERLQKCLRATWWDELQPGALIVTTTANLPRRRRMLVVLELVRGADVDKTPTHLNARDCDTSTCVRQKGGYVDERHVCITAADLLQDYPAIAKRWTLLRPAPALADDVVDELLES